MTTKRETLLRLIRGEDPGEILVSPLIDSWVLPDRTQKAYNPDEEDEYYSAYVLQGPLEDQYRMGDIVGYEPIAVKQPDWSLGRPSLSWSRQLVGEDPVAKLRAERLTLHTPYGDLSRRRESSVSSSRTIDESTVTMATRHKIIEWYVDECSSCDLEPVKEQIRGYVQVRGERGLLSGGVAAGPWGLFGIVGSDVAGNIYHFADYPNEHRRLADKILEVAKLQASTMLECGYDLIWNGGGTGMSSAAYRRSTSLPYDLALNAYVKSKGGLIYTHDCQPVMSAIREGLFNEQLPSVLETLSPPPAGDVSDLAAARRMLDARICTKGNIEVGRLLEADVEEIRAATLDVIAATKGFRHMVGTGDDVYDGTPIENLQAIVDTAKNYTGRWFATV
jgi:hypothetical protein